MWDQSGRQWAVSWRLPMLQVAAVVLQVVEGLLESKTGSACSQVTLSADTPSLGCAAVVEQPVG